MRAGPVYRDGRAESRAGAAILVLLAALLHLLACAHGPAPAADSLPAGPAAAVAIAVVTADSDAEHGPDQHCCHEDEPTIQAPRDTDAALPSAHLTASSGGEDGSVRAPGPGQSPAAPPGRGGLPIARSLALIGVSRT
ncbi:hypothetical protein ABZ865_23015 [Streptomyces sp. NPDC047085]|uniref:hypothetical protein n=1 Tax=Streptomyces sp. NPDC047085 TaxID=3155140 RepID=UPI0033C0C28E